ncbi:MAG: TetR/AcrR family transcriptional regulator [Sandarakinorhabdus sp.]|nr:TetR/AcrR family transcriptional regulator [Sandarakinorhabdus sp.]
MARATNRIKAAADGAQPMSHQAHKSAQTKARLVEATIRCLVKFGYSATTTPRVAEEAGLSRGAMLHHFESGRELMQATIMELHNKRLRAFRRAVESQRGDVHSLVHAYWSQLLRPTNIAFLELSVAARSDKELSAILEPARREFRQRWHELAIQLFPDWQSRPDNFRLALGLAQNMLEGMAINRLTYGLEESGVEELLAYAERQIVSLRTD